jgi:hypothetical protein
MRQLLTSLGCLLLVACSNAAPNDAGSDVPSSDVPTDRGFDPGDGGGACSSPDGHTTCSGGYGVTCCRGVESRFADGPCWPGPDAGVMGDAGSPSETDPNAAG